MTSPFTTRHRHRRASKPIRLTGRLEKHCTRAVTRPETSPHVLRVTVPVVGAISRPAIRHFERNSRSMWSSS